MRAAIFVLAAGLIFPSVATRADDPPKGWTFAGRTQGPTDEVQARVTGYLIRIAVQEGNAVEKGALLAEIDPRPYRLDLEAARARQKVAEAKLQVAKIKAANVKRLVKDRVVSQNEADLHLAEEAEADARVRGAKAEVDRAELNLSWTRITAPFSGRVSRIQSTEGGLVIADQTHIMKVVGTEPLYVVFNVSEAQYLQLRRDGRSETDKLDVAVGFANEQGHPHAARLDSIGHEVDPKTGTVRCRARIENPKGILVPGMSARVRLTPASK